MHYYRRKPLDTTPPVDGKRLGYRPRLAALERMSATSAEASQCPPMSRAQALLDSQGRAPDTWQANPAQSAQMQEAAALVPAAASILDEEMAAGILAARDARNAAPSHGNDTRGAQPDKELLRDLHEFIDSAADLLVRLKGKAANPVAAGTGNAQIEDVPVLRPGAPVRAGRQAKIAMTVNNDDTRVAHFVPRCTDLLCAAGYRIAREHVTFFPHELRLEPDASTGVALDIDVPIGSEPGIYSGLLLASGLPYLRAIISVEVL